MSWALFLGLENRGETDLNQQRRQESHDKGQHWVDPDPDHADLVGENVAALFGRALDGHGALAHDQAAHDLDRGCDPVDLCLSDGSFTGLVISLSLLAADIDFGP